MFLQETYSSEKDETRWTDEFKGQMYFSHGTTFSSDVDMGYFGTKSFKGKHRKSDKNGRLLLLLLDAKIDD